MAQKRLELVPCDPAWPERFAREGGRIAAAIGSHAIQLEHVGSTAVPGLLAKPVIDIGVAVRSLAAAYACIEPLQALGYEYRGMHGDDPARRYYVLNGGGRRLVQVHLYVVPARSWDEKLAFRDALRANPQLAAAYAAEKLRVASEVAWDKAAYARAKEPFIRAALDALTPRARPRAI